MACHICPATGSRMCGVKSCAECDGCDLADIPDQQPSERMFEQGVGIG